MSPNIRREAARTPRGGVGQRLRAPGKQGGSDGQKDERQVGAAVIKHRETRLPQNREPNRHAEPKESKIEEKIS